MPRVPRARRRASFVPYRMRSRLRADRDRYRLLDAWRWLVRPTGHSKEVEPPSSIHDVRQHTIRGKRRAGCNLARIDHAWPGRSRFLNGSDPPSSPAVPQRGKPTGLMVGSLAERDRRACLARLDWSSAWLPCSTSRRQRPAAVKRPHDPAGADETHRRSTAHGLERRLPGR